MAAMGKCCSWCFHVSDSNQLTMPMLDTCDENKAPARRVFCSRDCLTNFKEYALCDSCGKDTFSAQHPVRVDVNNTRKGFCSQTCLYQYQKAKNVTAEPVGISATSLVHSQTDRPALKSVEHSEQPLHKVPETPPSPSNQISTNKLFVTPSPTPKKRDHIKTLTLPKGNSQRESIKDIFANSYHTPPPSPAPLATQFPRQAKMPLAQKETPTKFDETLSQIQGLPAPSKFFKQAEEPPTNEFLPGMKLESVDPRNLTSTCIATVVAVHGPRIKVRLDGADDRNDFWRMVDCNTIHRVGHRESTGYSLNPPLGFQYSPSWLPQFLVKALNGATIAPESCFKPDPKSPSRNMFRVGHKLEAVDRKNPALICPATIGDVKKDEIHVCFDGWKGIFDYWCRFDSRDIFPVGWCAKAGYPLQPPGQHSPKVAPTKAPNKRKASSDPSVAVNAAKKKKNNVVASRPSTSNVGCNGQGQTNRQPTYQQGKSENESKAREAGSTTAVKNVYQPGLVGLSSLPRVPAAWSPGDVSNYLIAKDPDLKEWATILQNQKIDGPTFLLLDSDSMINKFGFKVGPALKVADMINTLKASAT